MNKLKWAIFWVVVWDALWVPYEFMDSEEILEMWDIKMRSWWSWSQPIGTWSDDSSMTLCLLESLSNWYDLKDIADKFIKWKKWEIWNANDYVFDIGFTTSNSINNLIRIFEEQDFECLKYLKNEASINSNGNGSLMRILPLLWEIRWKDIKEQFCLVWEVSALTHPHIISAISCLIYLKIWEKILEWEDKIRSYLDTKQEVKNFLKSENIEKSFINEFDNILEQNIFEINKNDLVSSWYVVKTLEVSLYCFLKYDNYEQILKEVIKFWWDTDTAWAVSWWIAWLYYWFKNIPLKWLNKIKKYSEIEKLITK